MNNIAEPVPVEVKWKIAFSNEEQAWIMYRVLSKEEAEAHLTNFDKQMEILQAQKNTWELVKTGEAPPK